MKTHLETLASQWQDTFSKIKQIGADAYTFQIEKPASQEEIARVEQRLGYTLPAPFKEALQFSKHAEVKWYVRDVDEFASLTEYLEIFSGEIGWSLDWLEDLTELSYIMEDKGLIGKLAFYSVGNGDLITFDMNDPNHPIYYWGHEGEGLTYLAPDFMSFLEHITALHLVGPDLWQLQYFIDPNRGGLNPKLPTAQRWIQIFNEL